MKLGSFVKLFGASVFLVLPLGGDGVLYGQNAAPDATVTAVPLVAEGPAKIEAYVDKALATPKETITYEVIFTYPKDLTAALPEFFGQIGGMRILDFEESPPQVDERHPDQLMAKRRLQLKADLTGTYILPAIHWSYTYHGQNYAAHSGEIFLEISAEGTGADPSKAISTSLKDIKPLRVPHAPWKFSVGAIWLGWLVLMALLLLLRRRWGKGPAGLPLNPRVAVQLALTNLRPLLDAPAWPNQAMKQVAFTISEALRHFIDEEFHYQSSEATWPQLKKMQGALAPADWQELLKILEPLEEIKFADRFWPQTAAQKHWQIAETWVQNQIAQLEAAEENAKAKVSATNTAHHGPAKDRDDDFL